MQRRGYRRSAASNACRNRSARWVPGTSDRRGRNLPVLRARTSCDAILHHGFPKSNHRAVNNYSPRRAPIATAVRYESPCLAWPKLCPAPSIGYDSPIVTGGGNNSLLGGRRRICRYDLGTNRRRRAEERIGPFENYEAAKAVWQARAWATVDNARARYRIEEDGSDLRYWVMRLLLQGHALLRARRQAGRALVRPLREL